MRLLQINPAAGPPDCLITAEDGAVCPAWELRVRDAGGVALWVWHVVHPTMGIHAVTPARLGELYTAGRVTTDIYAETAEAPEAPAETRGPSERLTALRRVDLNVPLRERLRRLLNARATALHKLTGEYVDDVRHEAVRDATDGRTESSMDRSVSEAEMEHAVSFVEDALYHAGFDFDAEDAAYWERRAAREGLTRLAA